MTTESSLWTAEVYVSSVDIKKIEQFIEKIS